MPYSYSKTNQGWKIWAKKQPIDIPTGLHKMNQDLVTYFTSSKHAFYMKISCHYQKLQSITLGYYLAFKSKTFQLSNSVSITRVAL